MPQPPAPLLPPREPAINLPPAVKALEVLLILVQLAVAFTPATVGDALITNFGFVPARFWMLLHGSRDWLAALTFLTYMLLHGGWLHLGVNLLSLAAFGSAVERLAGGRALVVIFVIGGIAGAAVQYLVDPLSNDVLVGASAGITGLFGWVFLWLARPRNQPERRRGPRRIGLIVLMIALLAITGMIGLPGVDAPIAWIAHIGGFVAGCLCYGFIKQQQR